MEDEAVEWKTARICLQVNRSCWSVDSTVALACLALALVLSKHGRLPATRYGIGDMDRKWGVVVGERVSSTIL